MLLTAPALQDPGQGPALEERAETRSSVGEPLPYGPRAWGPLQWATAAGYVLLAIAVAVLVARVARPRRRTELDGDDTPRR